MGASHDATTGTTGRLRSVPRWVPPLFAVLGAATVPWTVYLSLTLPQHARTHHYRLAWVGFDVLLTAVLLATAHAAWRGRRLVGPLAASIATMLVVDAWFDVTMSGRSGETEAVLSAALIEIPLAAVCGWIALHVDRVVESRLHQLDRRAARLRERIGSRPLTGSDSAGSRPHAGSDRSGSRPLAGPDSAGSRPHGGSDRSGSPAPDRSGRLDPLAADQGRGPRRDHAQDRLERALREQARLRAPDG